MIKIMLVCCAGMSTSLLVNRMNEEAKKRGLEAKIWATAEGGSAAEYEKDPCDVLLVGPQIRYLLKKLTAMVDPAKTGVDLIDMRTYGLMDGAKVLDQALKIAKK